MRFNVFLFLVIWTPLICAREVPRDSTAKDSMHIKTPQAATNPDLDKNDVNLFIDKIEIRGELEKPQAVFVLPGQTPDIDDIQINRSFFKELFRPVEKRHTVETKYSPDDGIYYRKDVIEW